MTGFFVLKVVGSSGSRLGQGMEVSSLGFEVFSDPTFRVFRG